MKKKRISRKFHKLNKERGLVAFCRNLCYSIIAVEKQQGAVPKTQAAELLRWVLFVVFPSKMPEGQLFLKYMTSRTLTPKGGMRRWL